MRGHGRSLHLSRRRWVCYDPGERRLVLTYDPMDELWQVRWDEDPTEHLDADLRTALAAATESEIDEPWILELADLIEHDLDHPQGEST